MRPWGVDEVVNLRILEKRGKMNSRPKNTTPGRVTGDFPDGALLRLRHFTVGMLPAAFAKMRRVFFKNQEVGEEKQKGRAVRLFLARLGAGETAMTVMQLVPLRRSHHYSNPG